jgi:hypothetical protein
VKERRETHEDIDDEDSDVATAIGKGPAELLEVLVAACILAVCERRKGQPREQAKKSM